LAPSRTPAARHQHLGERKHVVILAVGLDRICETGAHLAWTARAAEIEERPLLAIESEACMTAGRFKALLSRPLARGSLSTSCHQASGGRSHGAASACATTWSSSLPSIFIRRHGNSDDEPTRAR
jgi:hypothetical protein